THEPCAMCAGACVWSKIGAVVFGVSQEDITDYGKKHGTEEFKCRACLISCKFVLEKGGLHIPVFGNFLRLECRRLFGYRASWRASPHSGRPRANEGLQFLRRRAAMSLLKLVLFTLAATLAGSTTVGMLNVQI